MLPTIDHFSHALEQRRAMWWGNFINLKVCIIVAVRVPRAGSGFQILKYAVSPRGSLHSENLDNKHFLHVYNVKLMFLCYYIYLD